MKTRALNLVVALLIVTSTQGQSFYEPYTAPVEIEINGNPAEGQVFTVGTAITVTCRIVADAEAYYIDDGISTPEAGYRAQAQSSLKLKRGSTELRRDDHNVLHEDTTSAAVVVDEILSVTYTLQIPSQFPGQYKVEANSNAYGLYQNSTGGWVQAAVDAESDLLTFEVIEGTPPVIVYLKDNAGTELAGESVLVQPAYGGSWGPTYSGTTDSEGAFSIDEMAEGYTKIRMTLNQASVEQTVAELDVSGHTWTAVPLTIQFQDDAGGGLADGKVDQGGGTWVHHGYTDTSGQLTVNVFPERQYKFRVGYVYTSMTKSFDVPGPGAHIEVFQTDSATVRVLDYEASGLAGVRVDQGGGSWVHHGYTNDDGELSLVLFGDTGYKFKVSGAVVSNSSQTAWFTVPGPIEFQAGYVVSSGAAIKASIGGSWITYSSPGMNILPGTYKFVFAAPTPSPQWVTVVAGEVTNIP